MRMIVICEGLAGGGAAANVAWQQALGLSQQVFVGLISDGLSPERRRQLAESQGPLHLCLVRLPVFMALRRFFHLPRQLLWIFLAVRATQSKLQGAQTAVNLSHPSPGRHCGLSVQYQCALGDGKPRRHLSSPTRLLRPSHHPALPAHHSLRTPQCSRVRGPIAGHG